MEIASARPEEVEALTHIALAAKRHWGYPETWVQRWIDVLTITSDYVRANSTFVARGEDGERVGFAAVRAAGDQADALQLDHLWVLPAAMGRGVGRALFAHAEQLAREAGKTRLFIEGDPHAEGFYRRMGALVIGWEPAPMDGDPERRLPLLEKRL